MNAVKLCAFTSIAGLLFVCSCTPPGWAEYRAGMRCTLKNDPECEKFYQSAIEKNPALPGVHSSYGTYLYTKGNKEDAAAQFKKEVEQYPQSKKAVENALNPLPAVSGTDSSKEVAK